MRLKTKIVGTPTEKKKVRKAITKAKKYHSKKVESGAAIDGVKEKVVNPKKVLFIAGKTREENRKLLEYLEKKGLEVFYSEKQLELKKKYNHFFSNNSRIDGKFISPIVIVLQNENNKKSIGRIFGLNNHNGVANYGCDEGVKIRSGVSTVGYQFILNSFVKEDLKLSNIRLAWDEKQTNYFSKEGLIRWYSLSRIGEVTMRPMQLKKFYDEQTESGAIHKDIMDIALEQPETIDVNSYLEIEMPPKSSITLFFYEERNKIAFKDLK